MTSHLVRSGRTVVLGDSPVARGLRAVLDAGGASGDGTSAASGGDLLGAAAVVVVGQTGDFAAVPTRRVAEQRSVAAEQVRSAVAAAARAGVEHVVGISSAMVEGAAPDRQPIDDADESRVDAHDVQEVDGAGGSTSGAGSTESLDPGSTDTGAAGDLLAFEAAILAAAADEGVERVTVLRPAVLVGPDVDTLLTRHFEAPRILTVRGVRRDWQLVHLDDLASAVAVAVERRLTGALTVGAVRDGRPDVLSPEEVVEVSGLRAVDLPAAVAFATAERLHRLGVLPSPASDLACTVYPWTVTSRRLVAAGWSPTWSSRACLELLVEQTGGRTGVGGRRVARRDAAALGAAGAAVALLGTAAVWRQARGRR